MPSFASLSQRATHWWQTFTRMGRVTQAELVCGVLTVLTGLFGLGFFAFVSLPATHQPVSLATYAFLGIIVLILVAIIAGLYMDLIQRRIGGMGVLMSGSIGMFWFMALGVFAYGPALVPSFLFSAATFILAMVHGASTPDVPTAEVETPEGSA